MTSLITLRDYYNQNVTSKPYQATCRVPQAQCLPHQMPLSRSLSWGTQGQATVEMRRIASSINSNDWVVAVLPGAVFAASNAALALAQLGDEGQATVEMSRIARRAPGSADMRAALAALYWSQARIPPVSKGRTPP